MEKKEKEKFMRSTFAVVFGLFMVVFYITMAILVIFTPIFGFTNSPVLRYSLGILFLAYGIYRGWREWKMRK